MSILRSLRRGSLPPFAALLCVIVALASAFGATSVWAQTGSNPFVESTQLTRVRGSAIDIAIAVDGSAYSIDPEGSVWVQKLTSGGTWTKLPGEFRSIRAGFDGSIRAIGFDGRLFMLVGSWWRGIGSLIVRDVAVTPDGNTYVLAIDGSLEALDATGELLGRLDSSEAGEYQRVVVDEHGLPWLWNERGAVRRFDGLNWVLLNSFSSVGIRALATGIDGTVLLVDGNGRVYRWRSDSADWVAERVAEPMSAAAIGPGGKPWYLSESGSIWASTLFSGSGVVTVVKTPALFTRLLSWRQVNGQSQLLSVGADATVMSIDATQNAWRWKGKEGWSPLPGKFKRIAAGTGGSAWGIDPEDRLLRYATGQWFDMSVRASEVAVGPQGNVWIITTEGSIGRYDVRAKLWQDIAHAGRRARVIAAGNTGNAGKLEEPWIIDVDGLVSRRVEDRWVVFPGISAASLAVGPEGTVYATTPALDLFWLDLKAREWKPATGVARSVAVGPAGAPWIVGARSELYASTSFIAQKEASPPAGSIPLQSPPAVLFISPPAASVLPQLTKPLLYSAIAGHFVDVGIGADGSVFAAGADGGLYCFDNASKQFKFALPGNVRKLAVNGNGAPWIVDTQGRVAYFEKTEWVQVPDFKAVDIAIGSDGAAYAANAVNDLVYRFSAATQSFEMVTNYRAGVPLRAKSIAFSGGQLWAVTPSKQLLLCTGDRCQLQSVSATDVGSGPEGSVFITDLTGGVQRWNARAGSFVSVKGSGVALSVGPQGLPWLVSSGGQILAAGMFAVGSKAINTANCAQKFQSRALPVVVAMSTPVAVISATSDTFVLNPGDSASVLDNDSLNGAIPTLKTVRISFVSASPLLSMAAGRVVLSASAASGSVHFASYTLCAALDLTQCATAQVTVTVPARVSAVADIVTLEPGATFSLLANDTINGGTAIASELIVRFTTNSAYLSQLNGVLTLASGAPRGTTQAGSYSLCVGPAGSPCSGSVEVRVSVPSVLTAVADRATIAPGGSLNLLANDTLNGTAPVPSQVTVTFSTSSTYLQQAGGVLTLAATAPPGSIQNASYSICITPANTQCSGQVSVSITVPGSIAAAADIATLRPGGTINLLANDTVNGAVATASLVAITFNTPSAYLSQTGGILTLAPAAPAGSTQTATYRICLAPGNTLCSESVAVTINVPASISASADATTLLPGATFNLLANDSLNGAVPTAALVTVTFGTSSAYLSQVGGVLTLAASAPAGSTQTATYRICLAPANTLCSESVAVTINVPASISASADATTLLPGATLNLLANDSLNGAVPTAALVTVTFGTSSAFLSQVGGVLTLASSAPAGSTQTATYRICVAPANTLCSESVAVTINVPASIAAIADAATLVPGTTFNLLANDLFNGVAPVAGQVNVIFSGASVHLTQAGGLLTLARTAPTGSVQRATYTICSAASNTLCSGPVNVVITVPGVVTAVADAARLLPGGTLNLLTNDLLNGAAVQATDVIVTFASVSTYLTQAGGVLTLSANAPRGTTLSATYSLCAAANSALCSATVSVSITVSDPIDALADNATLAPGGTLNLLANDRLNGVAPTAALVSVTFNSGSSLLRESGGVLTLSAAATPGTVLSGSYRICQSSDSANCTGVVPINVTVASAIIAIADSATLNPGGSLNLLANDSLNGAVPLASQVTIAFNTASAYLNQVGGVLTLAAAAPPGSTQTASYSLCQSPANAVCSGTVSVTISVSGTVSVVADAATLSPGGTLNLLANDTLNGAVPLSNEVNVTFNTASVYLTQVGGLLTLAVGSPAGSVQTATYSICQSPANTLCSATVAVTITVTSTITAVADSATISPGSTFNLLANDRLNGSVPLSSQVTVTFQTSSENLTQVGGLVTLAAIAAPGTTHVGTYSICQSPANTLCSGTVGFTISATSTINAVADAATLSPGGTLNLLANDNLNGGAPNSSTVTVTFNTASPYLSQNGGLLTLAAGAPAGSSQTATYSICRTLGNTPCSGPVSITVTVLSAITAVSDSATLNAGGTLNLLANDSLNGAVPLASQVNVSFNTGSAFLSQLGGVLTLAAGAPPASTQSATYSICESPANTPCSATVNVTINVSGTITATADSATLGPGGTLNLLANDSLNGAVPLASQVTVTFNTASPYLTQVGGLLTLAAGAPTGSTQAATYRICESPANTLCSSTIAVTINVLSTLTAVADAATLSPGGTLNLLGNDDLNGAAPLSSQVSVTFNTASAYLSQVGGLLTLAAGAPGGTTQTATYSICKSPANTPCSGTVSVTITVPSTIAAVADAATLSPGGTLNLLANDSLNGAAPLAAQVNVTFNTSSAYLSQAAGVLSLAAAAPPGSTQTATYSICQSPANTLCSATVTVTITVPSTIAALADVATLSPGSTLNLLANDSLNGAVPLAAQVNVTFNTGSAYLSQIGGVLTLAASAPDGSIQTATYSICQSPANTLCSAAVSVTITLPVTVVAVNDGTILLYKFGGTNTFNLSTNDTLRGAPVTPATVVYSSADTNFSVSAAGIISINLPTPIGTYSVNYRVCEAGVPTNCADAVATIQLGSFGP